MLSPYQSSSSRGREPTCSPTILRYSKSTYIYEKPNRFCPSSLKGFREKVFTFTRIAPLLLQQRQLSRRISFSTLNLVNAGSHRGIHSSVKPSERNACFPADLFNTESITQFLQALEFPFSSPCAPVASEEGLGPYTLCETLREGQKKKKKKRRRRRRRKERKTKKRKEGVYRSDSLFNKPAVVIMLVVALALLEEDLSHGLLLPPS